MSRKYIFSVDRTWEETETMEIIFLKIHLLDKFTNWNAAPLPELYVQYDFTFSINLFDSGKVSEQSHSSLLEKTAQIYSSISAFINGFPITTVAIMILIK